MGLQQVTVATAAELEEVSQRRIRELISQGRIVAQKSKCNTGAPGGRQWMVDPHSLSTSARVRWQRRMAAAEEFQTEEESSPPALPVPVIPGAKKREGAQMKGDAVNPAAYIDVAGTEAFEKEMSKAKYKYDVVTEAKAVIDSKQNVTERIKALAAREGVNAATIYRWIKESEAGIYGLLRKRPTVVAGKSFRAINPDMETIIRKFYQAPGEPKAAAVYRKVVKFCHVAGMDSPSRATVFRFIQYLEDTEPDVCCYTRKGQEAWLEKYAPHGTRAEPERVMQIVMGDHHKFDVFIEYGGVPVRPWVTMWFDVKSRCPVGWTVSTQANGETIALAMAHMMTPKKRTRISADGEVIEETLEMGGIPETVYIDNGEDYKSRLKKGLASKDFAMSPESLDLCTHLGVKTVFATPYWPQAKAHIERWFGTVARQFSPEMPGWCGAEPNERPAGFDEQKLCKQGKLLGLVEFAERFEQWILNEYIENEHGTIKQAPLVAHLQGPKARPGWPDPRTLDILRCVKEKAKVYKEGIRRFNRLYWHNALDALAGQDVIIRYDPSRIGEIHIFTVKGGFVCTATNAELMQYGACHDDVKKVMKRRSQRKKEIRERMRQNEEQFDSLKTVTEERKAAGTRMVPGTAASTEGLLPAITPLDQAGRQVAKEKAKRQKIAAVKETCEPKRELDPIEAMILGRTI